MTWNRHPYVSLGCVRGTSDIRQAPASSGTELLRRAAAHEGESIKALSEYLGHADPGFTLRTYTHLVEHSVERTERAVDAVFRHQTPPADDAEETPPDA